MPLWHSRLSLRTDNATWTGQVVRYVVLVLDIGTQAARFLASDLAFLRAVLACSVLLYWLYTASGNIRQHVTSVDATFAKLGTGSESQTLCHRTSSCILMRQITETLVDYGATQCNN